MPSKYFEDKSIAREHLIIEALYLVPKFTILQKRNYKQQAKHLQVKQIHWIGTLIRFDGRIEEGVERVKTGVKGSSNPSRWARGRSRQVRSRGYWQRRLPRAETVPERLGELAADLKDKKERERQLRKHPRKESKEVHNPITHNKT